MYDPSLDGIEHLNIYSRAKTRLGRDLSHFAHTPIEIPEDGCFESVEGYWYWLSCHDDALRRCHGHQAKRMGRERRKSNDSLMLNDDRKVIIPPFDFKAKIMQANRIKIDSHPDIKDRLMSSTLPLVHYYVMQRFGQQFVQDKGNDNWIWNDIAKYRSELKGEPEPVLLSEKVVLTPEENQMSLF